MGSPSLSHSLSSLCVAGICAGSEDGAMSNDSHKNVVFFPNSYSIPENFDLGTGFLPDGHHSPHIVAVPLTLPPVPCHLKKRKAKPCISSRQTS
jgi:hypothetical protein